VGKEKEVKDAFRLIEAQFGKVDILFNNAGIAGPNIKVIEMSLDEWSQVINTDLTGCFYAQRSYQNHVEQKSGKIITLRHQAFRGDYPFSWFPLTAQQKAHL
jgi:NAD(P)-dependent dehydrogenase (short-subunit alcohol dehydrogenase family)